MPFEPKGFAKDIFTKRYTIHENESWADASRRVANYVAAGEHASVKRHAFQEDAYQMLVDNLFMPGGRIWYGSGRAKGQLLNCFVIGSDILDSREGWGKAVSDMIVISGTGGGVGINCSRIRPRGSLISGTGGLATGAVSLMEVINAAGEVIKAGGGRRTALMLCLNYNHPDILEFLDKKLDLNQLNNANVSVFFQDDPEEFFRKVRNDEDLELKFGNKVYKVIKARDLWSKIVRNGLKSAEPGILNGYLANKTNGIWYHAEITSTNPCGEIPLEDRGVCCLGALVLPRFVKGNSINWGMLTANINLAVRFLDNVLTVNNYPLAEIAEEAQAVRRIGLGVMGVHDYLLMRGLKYNSPEGLEEVDRIGKFIKNTAYRASIDLAKEKGPFPKFRAEEFSRSAFIKSLRPTIRKEIIEHGIRNCAILTIAPTGTTSMVAGVSSGIEPMFAPAYERRWFNGDVRETEVVVHPLFQEFVQAGKDVSHFQGTYDLSIRDHFEMQRTYQRHIDNAVSKTVNIPQGTSEAELSELYMEYFPELKGTTVYPEGSRENQPLTALTIEQALTHVGNAQVGSAGLDSCKDGKCDV